MNKHLNTPIPFFTFFTTLFIFIVTVINNIPRFSQFFARLFSGSPFVMTPADGSALCALLGYSVFFLGYVITAIGYVRKTDKFAKLANILFLVALLPILASLLVLL